MLSQRALEAFHAVIKLGTISAAADDLSISQPAVSRLLRDLEDRTGLVLFTRAGNRVIATDAARALFLEVDRAFISLTAITSKAQKIKNGIHGSITINAMPILSTTILTDVICALDEQKQQLDIELHSARSSIIIPMVAKRDAMLGFISARRISSDVTVLRHDDLPFRCIVNADDPLCEKKSVLINDLSGRQVIGFTNTTMTGRVMDKIFAQMWRPPHVHLRVHLSSVASAIILRRGGVSIVDPFAANQHELLGGISLPMDMDMSFGVTVIAPRGLKLSTEANLVLQQYEDDIGNYSFNK